jgi:hypothetical protein
VCLVLVSIETPAHAACTNATLLGSFGYQEQGEFPGGGFSEFRAVGEFTFDGKGNGTRHNTNWYSDFEVVADTPHPITYSVAPDCRFTLTYSDSLETFAGVIVSDGMKILYIETSGDPSRSGQGERIHSSN